MYLGSVTEVLRALKRPRAIRRPKLSLGRRSSKRGWSWRPRVFGSSRATTLVRDIVWRSRCGTTLAIPRPCPPSHLPVVTPSYQLLRAPTVGRSSNVRGPPQAPPEHFRAFQISTVKYGALGIAFKEFAGESGCDSLGDIRN